MGELCEDEVDVHLFVGLMSYGFVFEFLSVVILGTQDVFFVNVRFKCSVFIEFVVVVVFESFRSFIEGDFVVYVDYGIGWYDGLMKLVVDGIENDFLKLVY